MKQVIQPLQTNIPQVCDVPTPGVRAGSVLVHTAASLVSAGTERMVVDFAEKNLVQKARSRPDLVKQTIDKAKREGILTTIDAVRNRLDQPMALGYSSAGTVLEAGSGVEEFHRGDRVTCAGGGYASHAEIVVVPQNLVVKLPPDVDSQSAAFTTLGAIALQGIRLADVKLGEIVAVIGLGLLGQLTVQMLKAAGCIVLGMDIQPQRVELARTFGIDFGATSSEELMALCQQVSGGHGVDSVLITADTKSNQPVEIAGEVTRERGVVVAVGAVGMEIPRKIYYEKELDFRISRSYGPGRYDPTYEEEGHDYPYGYVRWTERRNMQAFVQLLIEGKVKVHPLITHRFPVEEAAQAYQVITGKTGEPFLGVVLTYSEQPDYNRTIRLPNSPTSSSALSRAAASEKAAQIRPSSNRVALGVLGAGLFANATLLPAIKENKAIDFVAIASGSGLTARTTADRFSFGYCTTETQKLLTDPAINTVAILTRHDLHARQVLSALDAGKHVYVEKPLCLTEDELASIIEMHRQVTERAAQKQEARPVLMVGFNRRFAPFVNELRPFLREIKEPLMLHYRVNAGFIPREHWVHDPNQGGGRLLGEGCHFIDLLIDLADSAPQRVTTRVLPDSGRYRQDNFVVTLEFENGSIGILTYVANGDKSSSKEFLEIFGGGLSARLEDYRSLSIHHGSKEVNRTAKLRQDKGHKAEWQAFTDHLTGSAPVPIAFESLIRSSQATLAAQQSLQSGEPVDPTSIATGEYS